MLRRLRRDFVDGAQVLVCGLCCNIMGNGAR